MQPLVLDTSSVEGWDPAAFVPSNSTVEEVHLDVGTAGAQVLPLE